MKQLLRYTIILFSVYFFSSCDDMNSIHQKYLDEGEIVYLGIPEIVKVSGGDNRVQVVWKLNADPKIDECCIYWNNRSDSVSVTPDRTDSVMTHIIPLPEGKYILEMVNRNKKGHKSLTVNVSAQSYGDNYRDLLYNRLITRQETTPEKVVLKWSLEEGCIGVDFNYINNEGVEKNVLIEEDQTELVISDYVPGGKFRYSSLYLPEKDAIDVFSANEVEGHFNSYFILSKSDWESNYKTNYEDLASTGWDISANTEELTGEGAVNGRASVLFDGNPSTFWHSQWSNNARPPLPHIINIDMKESNLIASVEVARRQSNKDTKKVLVKMSSDNNNWNDIGLIEFPNDPNPNSLIIMLPNPVEGRYIRLEIVESNNAPHASLSGLYFTTVK